MKLILKFLLAISMNFYLTHAGAQSGKDILLKASQKSDEIQNGYYEVNRRMLYMTHADTQSSSMKTYFKLLPEDKVFGFAFFMPFVDSTGKITYQSMYTGNELVRVNYKDSTAIVTSSSLWKDDIENTKHNFEFYSPFISAEGDKIEHKFKPARNYNVEIIGMERINNHDCYHIKVQDFEKSAKTDPFQVLRNESHYWVSSGDFLVHKFSKALDLVMDNDTMHQFEEMTLDSFVLNEMPEKNIPGMDAIPAFITLKDYTPYKREPLLAKGLNAPVWSLSSIKGESISLDSLKGNLVLIDFFYKSCYPCMQALPALESLHQKYRNEGLVVIGIDPFDKDADDLGEFLSKRNVSYNVMLSDKDLPKAYQVSGYPTMYLLDENGIILHANAGYGESIEKILEKIIQEHLD